MTTISEKTQKFTYRRRHSSPNCLFPGKHSASIAMILVLRLPIKSKFLFSTWPPEKRNEEAYLYHFDGLVKGHCNISHPRDYPVSLSIKVYRVKEFHELKFLMTNLQEYFGSVNPIYNITFE